MLRVRKDIDLKTLEDYNFKNMIFSNVYRYEGKDTSIYVNKKDRTLSVGNFIDGNIQDLSIIYKLSINKVIEEI